ncbi:MAG: hypothetical protein WCO55_05280 [Candidatus Falkowbacteria bacterium]
MGALPLLLIAVALGWPLAGVLFKERSQPEKLALAWLLGAFVITWQLFIFLFWLKAGTFWWFNLIFLAEAIILWLFLKAKINWRDFRAASGAKPGLLDKILLCILALVIMLSFVNACGRGNIGWDSLNIWSIKAKQIYYSGRVIFDSNNPASWQSRAYLQYPWHGSLLYVWGNELNGSYSDAVNNVINWFYYVSIIILVYGFLAIRIDRRGAAAFTLMLASAPIFYFHSFNSYSDLMLGCYAALALIFLWRAWLGSKYAFIGLSMSLVAAYTTKNEGIFALLAASFFLLVFLTRQKKWRQLAWFVGLTGLLLAPWQIFRMVNHLGIANSTAVTAWHWDAIYQFWRTFWLNASFNIFAWVVLAVLAFAAIKIYADKKLLVAWVYVALLFSAFLYVYISTTSYQDAVYDTTISRNLITIFPALVIVTALSWQKISKK